MDINEQRELEVVRSNDMYHICELRISPEDILYGKGDTQDIYINIQYVTKYVAGSRNIYDTVVPRIQVNSFTSSTLGSIPNVITSATDKQVQVYGTVNKGDGIVIELILSSSIECTKVSTNLVPSIGELRGSWRVIPKDKLNIKRRLIHLRSSEILNVVPTELNLDDISRMYSLLVVGTVDLDHLYVDTGGIPSSINVEELIVNYEKGLVYYCVEIYQFVTGPESEVGTRKANIRLYHTGECVTVYNTHPDYHKMMNEYMEK